MDDCNRPSFLRFRSNVADHHPMGSSGEPAVGNQGHILMQSVSCKCRGGRKHFPHARAALWPFIADDDCISFFYPSCEDCIKTALLIFKDPGRPLMLDNIQAACLEHCTFRAQIALQYGDRARRFYRICKRMDNILPVKHHFYIFEVESDCLSCYRQAIAMKQTFVQKHSHDHWDASNTPKVSHDVSSGRLEISQRRSRIIKMVEIIDGKFYLCFASQCKKVQD